MCSGEENVALLYLVAIKMLIVILGVSWLKSDPSFMLFVFLVFHDGLAEDSVSIFNFISLNSALSLWITMSQ